MMHGACFLIHWLSESCKIPCHSEGFSTHAFCCLFALWILLRTTVCEEISVLAEEYIYIMETDCVEPDCVVQAD